MYRLLVVVAAVIAGAAIWRRREIGSDAERASKAIGGVTSSARSRLRSGRGDRDEAGDVVEDGEPATVTQHDVDQDEAVDSMSAGS